MIKTFDNALQNTCFNIWGASVICSKHNIMLLTKLKENTILKETCYNMFSTNVIFKTHAQDFFQRK